MNLENLRFVTFWGVIGGNKRVVQASGEISWRTQGRDLFILQNFEHRRYDIFSYCGVQWVCTLPQESFLSPNPMVSGTLR
jgi:hypothetical protein